MRISAKFIFSLLILTVQVELAFARGEDESLREKVEKATIQVDSRWAGDDIYLDAGEIKESERDDIVHYVQQCLNRTAYIIEPHNRTILEAIILHTLNEDTLQTVLAIARQSHELAAAHQLQLREQLACFSQDPKDKCPEEDGRCQLSDECEQIVEDFLKSLESGTFEDYANSEGSRLSEVDPQILNLSKQSAMRVLLSLSRPGTYGGEVPQTDDEMFDKNFFFAGARGSSFEPSTFPEKLNEQELAVASRIMERAYEDARQNWADLMEMHYQASLGRRKNEAGEYVGGFPPIQLPYNFRGCIEDYVQKSGQSAAAENVSFSARNIPADQVVCYNVSGNGGSSYYDSIERYLSDFRSEMKSFYYEGLQSRPNSMVHAYMPRNIGDLTREEQKEEVEAALRRWVAEKGNIVDRLAELKDAESIDVSAVDSMSRALTWGFFGTSDEEVIEGGELLFLMRNDHAIATLMEDENFVLQHRDQVVRLQEFAEGNLALREAGSDVLAIGLTMVGGAGLARLGVRTATTTGSVATGANIAARADAMSSLLTLGGPVGSSYYRDFERYNTAEQAYVSRIASIDSVAAAGSDLAMALAFSALDFMEISAIAKWIDTAFQRSGKALAQRAAFQAEHIVPMLREIFGAKFENLTKADVEALKRLFTQIEGQEFSKDELILFAKSIVESSPNPAIALERARSLVRELNEANVQLLNPVDRKLIAQFSLMAVDPKDVVAKLTKWRGESLENLSSVLDEALSEAVLELNRKGENGLSLSATERQRFIRSKVREVLEKRMGQQAENGDGVLDDTQINALVTCSIGRPVRGGLNDIPHEKEFDHTSIYFVADCNPESLKGGQIK